MYKMVWRDTFMESLKETKISIKKVTSLLKNQGDVNMSDNTKINLSSCPFCGCHCGTLFETMDGFRVKCKTCGVITKEMKTAGGAMGIWNKRSTLKPRNIEPEDSPNEV